MTIGSNNDLFPPDVISYIAYLVGDPSKFSTVCKAWRKGQLAAYSILRNDYERCYFLKTYCEIGFLCTDPQLVLHVYYKVISLARRFHCNDEITKTGNSYENKLSVRRLEALKHITDIAFDSLRP